MDTNNDEQVIQPAQKSKKVDRSAAYSAITIPEALEFTAEVYKNFRSAPTKREDIINLIEGAHNRHIAASTYYLFLNREKDTYQVSDLYKTIANPLSEKEKREGLLKAFGAPKLNKELIDKFDGDEVPKELVYHLVRFHRITDDAAPLAAEVFLKNAKYCGVLDDKNVLNYLNADNTPLTETIVEEIKPGDKGSVKPVNDNPIQVEQNNTVKQTLLIPEMTNADKIKIRLTENKFAYLEYPLSISIKDINILRKQLDVLEELAQ